MAFIDYDPEKHQEAWELSTVVEGNVTVTVAVPSDATPKQAARAPWNFVVMEGVEKSEREEVVMGGPGSGHHGHRGVPGQRGGSAPSGGLGSAGVPAFTEIQGIKDSDLSEWEDYVGVHPESDPNEERISFASSSTNPRLAKGTQRITIRDEDGNAQAIGAIVPPDNAWQKMYEVKYLASAPWNYSGSSDPRRVRGAGTAFMATVARKAVRENKLVGLEAWHDNIEFYKKLGMSTNYLAGIDDPPTMVWDVATMRQFLTAYDSGGGGG